MNYNQYLFSNLIKLYDSEFDNLEYDLQFERITSLYDEFASSEFNVDYESEYDCMVKYLKHKFHKKLG